jgi:hypothetical protein
MLTHDRCVPDVYLHTVTTGGAVGIGAAVLAVVSAFFIFIFIYRRRKRRASEPAINTPVGPVTGAATTNQM